jgi:hypothetical protein
MEESASDLLKYLIAQHGFDIIYGLLEQINEQLLDMPQKMKKDFFVVHKDNLEGG